MTKSQKFSAPGVADLEIWKHRSPENWNIDKVPKETWNPEVFSVHSCGDDFQVERLQVQFWYVCRHFPASYNFFAVSKQIPKSRSEVTSWRMHPRHALCCAKVEERWELRKSMTGKSANAWRILWESDWQESGLKGRSASRTHQRQNEDNSGHKYFQKEHWLFVDFFLQPRFARERGHICNHWGRNQWRERINDHLDCAEEAAASSCWFVWSLHFVVRTNVCRPVFSLQSKGCGIHDLWITAMQERSQPWSRRSRECSACPLCQMVRLQSGSCDWNRLIH